MKVKRKNIIFYTLLSLFVLNIFLFNWLLNASSKFDTLSNQLKNSEIQNEKTLIADTIRPQQRYMANSIRESWMKYIDDEKNFSLIKEKDGLPIYSNGYDNLVFNNSIMYKVKIKENIFDIYDRNTKKLILSNASPEWDKNKINKILNLLVKPIKSFGNNGGIIVFDSYNGHVFLDTTPADRTERHPNLSIFKDYENPNNKNPNLTKEEIKDFIEKKNSDRSSSFIYMFNDGTNMTDPNDFSKYKLGDYNRLFVEKIVLPYETFGFDGQPMQLTMLVVSDEQDIYKAFKADNKQFQTAITKTEDVLSELVLFGGAMTVIFMIVILIALYLLKYPCHKKDE